MKTMLIVMLAICAMVVTEEETLQAEEQTLISYRSCSSLCWPFAPWLSPKKRLFKLKSRPSSHMVLTPTLSVTDTELCLTPVCPTPLALFFLMLPTPPTPTPALTLSPPLPTTTTSWTPPRNHRLT